MSPAFTVDSEFESLLPPLPKEDYERLEQSILSEGCRDPLVVWQGKKLLVDGHNRREICKKHKRSYQIREQPFANREAVIAWIIENQKGRRNMTKFQWAEVVLKRRVSIAKKAKANQSAGGGSVHQNSDEPVNTLEKLAQLAGVSPDTMNKVENILKAHADNPDNEDLKEKVEALRKGEAGYSIHSVCKGIRGAKKTKRTKKAKKKTEASTEPALNTQSDDSKPSTLRHELTPEPKPKPGQKAQSELPQELEKEIDTHLHLIMLVLQRHNLRRELHTAICDKIEIWLQNRRNEKAQKK